MSAYSSASLRRRARLLAGCAVALGLAVQAQAQNAFQADVTGVPLGSANVSRGQTVDGRLTDIVTVNTKQAVINWSATGSPSGDGSVNVLAANNQLLFTADGNNTGDYTVLNRIAPTAPGNPAIRFDGIVRSQLDFGYGATQPGGNILFYSPGGIIAGATSQFDVGSLVLSAADILFDGTNGIFGSDLNAQTGTLRFRPEFGDTRSTVTIEQGAALRARDNYVALVAPRIVQNGTVDAKGSVAYVAAQGADITIPMAGGLFSIGVVEGSSVDPGGETTLTHAGTTTGPETDGSIANRRIYMVAVPKNDAVTMLVSGNVGYTPASSVQLADGKIILAAASDISNTDAVSGLNDGSKVQVNGGAFRSNLTVVADQVAVSSAGGDVTAAGDVELRSRSGDISLTALGGNDVTIAGTTLMRLEDGRAGSTIAVTANIGSSIGVQNLTVESLNEAGSSAPVTGGDISLNANGGIITAADISLTTLGQGSGPGDGTGGTIAITASASGQIMADSILAQATGTGGDSGYGAGDGTGGSVSMVANGGGLIQASNIELLAKGFGGNGSAGGKADGGAITVNATAGTITASNLNLDASAQGGDSFSSGTSGSGTGGSVLVTSGPGGQITGSGTFRASGLGGGGGFSSIAGDGTGGSVTVQLSGGSIDFSGGTASLIADGIGGSNRSAGPASIGRGGTVQVSIGSGSALSVSFLNLRADGQFDGLSDQSPASSAGGVGVGGTATFDLSGGTVQGTTITVNATGQGARRSRGGVGGSGYQGRAAFGMTGGTAELGLLAVRAEALGGDGNDQDSGYGIAPGEGGTAGIGASPYQGGQPAGAIVSVSGGLLRSVDVDVSADATGGIGGDGQDFASTPSTGKGGDATGGSASFASSGAASLEVGGLRVHAHANAEPASEEERTRGGQGGSIRYFGGFGGDAVASAGGTSTGGSATIVIGSAGSLAIGAVRAEATGYGGRAGEIQDADFEPITGNGVGGRGGDGIGGTASITFNAGLSDRSAAFVTAEGYGADGGLGPNGGSGGNGFGGNASLAIAGGAIDFGLISISGDGFGGRGADGNLGNGGMGGIGQGLNASMFIGPGAIITTESLAIYANGDGGRGGDGSQDAVGYDGGAGGLGKGGSVALTLANGSLTLFGGEGLSTANFSSGASGGQGGGGGTATEGGGGDGGNGGNATAGTINILSTNGSVDFPASVLTANATAGLRGFAGSGAVDGLEGVDGTALAGSVSIDAQHGGSATVQLDFGQTFLHADGRIDEVSGGRAGHVFVNAVGGSENGAIRFTNVEVTANGDLAAADALPAIRFTGSGLVNSTDYADLSAAGDVVLAARLNVGGSLDVRANGDIILQSGADAAVRQNISLRSGDDIIIGSGALLRGTSGEVPEAGYGGPALDIHAGGLGRRGGIIVNDISSFILEGTIDAADRTVMLQADAAVARVDTQFSAGNLYVLLTNVPEGNEAVPSDDLGQLRPLRTPACLQGDACFGNVSVSGYLEIGNPFLGVPINVRLNGGTDGERVSLLGRNVRLGQANQANFIKASESLSIVSLESSLFLDGALSIVGGSDGAYVASANNINGAQATISAPGTLELYAGNNLTLGGIDASLVRTVDLEGEVLEPSGIVVPGAITIGTVSTANTLNLRAGTGVSVELAFAPVLDMVTDAGLARLGSGTVGSASIQGESAFASVSAAGDVSVTATNGDATVGPISASNLFVFANGNIVSADVIEANAFESGYGSTGGGNIQFNALGDVDVSAGSQLLADRDISIEAGDDVRIGSGAILRAARTVPANSAPPLLQPGQIYIEAGAANESAAEPSGASNVHAILIGAGASLTGRTVLLTGQAIQGAADSDIAATNLFARISAAPPLSAAPLDDGGALQADCVRGNVCLGTLDVSGQLRIGEGGFVPNRLTVAGPIDSADVLLRSRDTLVLSGGLSATALELESLSGDVVLGSGAAFTTDGPMSIKAGRDLAGSGATVAGSAAVSLAAGRSLSLGILQAASLTGATPSSPLQVAGAIAIGQLEVGSNVGFNAGTGLNIGTALLGDNALQLAADTGLLSVGSATAGSLRLTGGDISFGMLSAGGGVALNATSGDIVGGGIAGGSVVLTASRNIDLDSATALTIASATAGGILDLTSAGAVSFSNLQAGGALNIAAQGDVSGGSARGATLAIATPGKIVADTLMATSGPLSATAGTGIALASVVSADVTTLATNQGAIKVTSDIVPGAGLIISAPAIDLTAQNGLTVVQATATAGDFSLKTVNGALSAGTASATGAISLTSAGDLSFASLNARQGVGLAASGAIGGSSISGSTVNAVAGSGIALSTLGTPGTATLAAGSGALTVTDATAANFIVSGGSIALASAASLDVTKASAATGDIKLTSEQDIRLGQVDAAGTLSADAGNGVLTVSGTTVATTIGFTSRDLAIGATAQLGSKAQTTSISFTSTADRMFLGDAVGTGYRIDAGEFGRIVSGGDIAIVSTPRNIVGTNFELLDPTGTNVVAGSFSFDGAQLGTNGTLTVDSERSIGFTGNVQFKNFVNSQTVVFDANSDISLAAETGLVTIKNSGGGLAGTMVLSAQQVHAMSTKARSEIPGLQLNEVRQRLGTNDQLENNGGYFQANRIIVNIGRLAYIQNSGGNGADPGLKRGITANELIINATGEQAAQLVINGVEGSVTGEAFRGAVSLNGSIDAQSGFNGCVSGTTCVPMIIEPEPEPEFFLPIDLPALARDQVQDEEDEDEKEEALQAAQTRPDPVIQVVPAPRSRFDPLIDEPVTGAGNEDLWEPTTPAGPTP